MKDKVEHQGVGEEQAAPSDGKKGAAPLPKAGGFDITLSLLRDPYRFIKRQCREAGADAFQSRLQLRKVVCLTGKEGAALFYDTDRFQREGAAPGAVQKTLFGQGGVQTVDGETHRARKDLFLSLLTDERVAALADATRIEWERAARGWEVTGDEVVLAEASREIIGRAVCSWAEVPLEEEEVEERISDMSSLFDEAGAVGWGHIRSRRSRSRAEDWAGGKIEALRAGRLHVSPDSVLATIALHRDPGGELLEPRVAAVELLNVLRPTIAVSVYMALAATALHSFPKCHERLEAQQHGYADLFAQETRRFYPFFPAVVARARQDFEWRGYRFPKGRRVLLDLYGTNHDEREWEDPDEFRPERFRGRVSCPFSFVPQGGGDVRRNHRCPGESVATELMKVALEFLVHRMEYVLPEQDLSIDFGRLPALPRSGFLISGVRLRG